MAVENRNKSTGRTKFFLILAFSFLLFFGIGLYVDEYANAGCKGYYCTGGCDAQLRYSYCCCSDCSCCCDVLIKDCHPWQMCNVGSRSCDCDGPNCVKTPKSPRYYDNPTYSDEPTKDIGNSNIHLPVKLDWDDVPGWYSDCPECVKSYSIRIKDTAKDNEGDYYRKVVKDESEYNYREDAAAGACLLRSDYSHDWRVKACCGADGTNCGGESSWDFTTSLAPELASPEDPDWNGPAAAAFYVPSGETFYFDWCDVSMAESYFYVATTSVNADYYYIWPIDPEVDPGTGAIVTPLKSEIYDDVGHIVREIEYKWKTAMCFLRGGFKCDYGCLSDQDATSGCAEWSQIWSFTGTTDLPAPILTSPTSTDPTSPPTVNFYDFLKWEGARGGHSYKINIYRTFDPVLCPIPPCLLGILGSELPTSTTYPLNNKNFWRMMRLDKGFLWKVMACWNPDQPAANVCKTESWSQEWQFRTTGAPPSFSGPGSGPADNDFVSLPIKLNWDNVPAAPSYRYQISTAADFILIINEGVTEASEILIGYPTIKMNTTYYWRVQSCADKTADPQLCGSFTDDGRKFTTLTVPPPNLLSPEPAEETWLPFFLKWERLTGGWKGDLYKYRLSDGAVREGTSGCCSAFFSEPLPTSINYDWQIKSCLAIPTTPAEESEMCGDWSASQTFRLIEPRPPAWGGLVPCGRAADDPNTSYNERETCQIYHFFLMLKNILDFFLWKLLPISIAILAVITGALYYFSAGMTGPIITAKSMLKAAGIGYVFIFFAWMLLTLVLRIFGITVDWWIITF